MSGLKMSHSFVINYRERMNFIRITFVFFYISVMKTHLVTTEFSFVGELSL